MTTGTGGDLQIFVVPYCHADWAWTHTRQWHAERYRLVFEEVLAVLRAQAAEGVPGDAPHAFRWYFDSFVTQLQPFLERRPDLLPELRRWVHAGRIAVCGTFANLRPNCLEGETFVRSLVLGRRALRALFPQADLSVDADLVDVGWGHPQLPQLLAQAGYRFLRGWRPHDALNAKGVPHHFVWRGLDGSEVLCSRGSYGGLVHPSFVPPDYRERWEEVVGHWERYELAEKRERSPVPLAWIAHGADDSRPLRALFTSDAPLDLVPFMQEWNRRQPSRMRFATPVEAFAALEARRQELPTITGTLDPCDVAYNAAYGGASGLWRHRREAARALLLAETLTVLAAHLTGAPSPQAALEDLWRDALTCSCHAQQWLFQRDFAEIVDLAQATTRGARAIADRAVGALASSVDLPEGAAAVVVNPLPFERTVSVPFLLSFLEADRGGAPAGLRLVDGCGRDVPYQVQSELRDEGIVWELEVLARMVLPAGGWNTVGWKAADGAAPPGVEDSTQRAPEPAHPAPPGRRRPPPPPPARLALENEVLRIVLDRGRVVRVEDKATGHVDAAPPDTPFGHLRAYSVDPTAPLHAGPVVGHQDAEWLEWAVVETGPVRQAVVVRGRVGRHPVSMELRLPAAERRIELATTVEWQGQDGFLALHVPLPAAGELWGGSPYGAERKELGREPYVGFERSRPGMFWAQDFVDWSDGSRGVACLPHDGDVYYRFDAARNVIAHILVNSFRRDTSGWERHVNHEIEARGRHTFVTSLVWHAGDWRAAELWALARSLAVPPLVVPRTRGRGALPPCHSVLAVEPATVCLAALYQEGDTTLVRLYETSGTETTATITFPVPVREASAVTLLNEPLPARARGAAPPGPAVAAGRRHITCRLRPWQIQTVAVRA